MSHWKDKVVLVTGGSAGLGLEIAAAFGLAGARVIVVGRTAEKLLAAHFDLENRGIARECILTHKADVTQPDQVQKLMATVIDVWGALHVLVNNVGISMRGEILQTPPEKFRQLFETNFLSMVHCIQAAAPHLLASKGHIVNMGSLAAKSAARYLGAYPASKFPVAALSQQLRLELGEQGVHTLLVCPGPLQRDDAHTRYAQQANHLPAAAQKPGGGVKLKGLPTAYVAQRILRACEKRQPELILPWKAKLLFTIAQFWPSLGDWLARKMT